MSFGEGVVWVVGLGMGLGLTRSLAGELVDIWRSRPVVAQDECGRWRSARYVHERRPYLSARHRWYL